MRNNIFILFLFVFSVLVSCQKPKKVLTVSKYNPQSNDFSFLKEALKDVKILALGESSHGFGNMHSLKAEMVQYLHKELGFDVLVMEAGYGDVGLSWHNIDKSETNQLLNSTLYPNLRSEQILPLFEYIKEQKDSEKPLQYRGMDSRISGLAFEFRFLFLLKRLEPKVIQDSIQRGMDEYYKSFEVLDDREQWQGYMDRYLGAIDFGKSILEESREYINEIELVDDVEVEILLKSLEMLAKNADYKFGEAYTRGLMLRDSLMAENVISFAENEFPDSKIIIWGHNGHIEKEAGEGDNIKWMGHYLKEKYKDKYYALGMYAKSGKIYQTSAKKVSNFNISDPSFIEEKLNSTYGNNVFLDLPKFDSEDKSWYNNSIFGYELEAGGKVNFVPSKRFDGVMLLEKTEAPDYIILKDNPRK